MHAISAVLYQQQAQQQQQGPQEEPKGEKKDEKMTDAEYKVVDEDKKLFSDWGMNFMP